MFFVPFGFLAKMCQSMSHRDAFAYKSVWSRFSSYRWIALDGGFCKLQFLIVALFVLSGDLLNPQGTYKLSQKQLGAFRFLRQVCFERLAGKKIKKAIITLVSLLCHCRTQHGPLQSQWPRICCGNPETNHDKGIYKKNIKKITALDANCWVLSTGKLETQ